MWQRIQTVFLIITILSLLISLVQPVWFVQYNGTTVILTPFYLLQSVAYVYVPYSITAVLGVAAITISVIEIRRYNNRLLQIKLGAFNSLLLAGMMICAVWFASQLSDEYPGDFKYSWGLYLIFVAVISNWLALRFIRKDERLVRDSERIR